MARPGGGGVRVQDAGDTVQLICVLDFQLVVLVQVKRDLQGVHRIDDRAAADHVGALCEGVQVRCQPVRRHAAVGVGGHDDAARVREHRGLRHGQAAGVAGVCLGGAETVFEDMQAAGQGVPQGAGDVRRAVRAVVDQQQDVGFGGTLLEGERAQAIADQGCFIFDGNGDDDLRHGPALAVRFANRTGVSGLQSICCEGVRPCRQLLVMLDHFAHHEREELFGELRIEAGGFGQCAQPCHLLGFTCGIGRGQTQAGFQPADLLRAFEALGEKVDERRIYVVDAGTQVEEFFWDHGSIGPLFSGF